MTVGELDGSTITGSKEHITDRAVAECMPVPVPAGTLLFSFKLSIGKMAIAGVPLYTNEAIAALPIRDSRLMSRSFLRYALLVSSHDGDTDYAVKGKLLNKRKVSAIPIPVPPLDEQERIAELLDAAEDLRRLRAEADRRTADLIPAIFHEMFGDPMKNPKGWKIAPFRELGTIVTGNTPPRKDRSYYGNYIDWVKTDNIDPVRGTVGVSTERLSKRGAARGRIIPGDSVLITCIAGSVGRIGDAAITNRKVAINQQINAIIPGKGVLSGFLGSLIGALKPLIQAKASGVMTRIITKSVLEKISVISPPLPLQHQFATRVAEVRVLEAQQAAGRQRLDDLFQSMLHRAFRGEL